jgi:hypothetical protein
MVPTSTFVEDLWIDDQMMESIAPVWTRILKPNVIQFWGSCIESIGGSRSCVAFVRSLSGIATAYRPTGYASDLSALIGILLASAVEGGGKVSFTGGSGLD